MKRQTKDFRQLIQEVDLIIRNWKDELNCHKSAETIVCHILKEKSVCDHNPNDTKIWTIALVKNLKPYPLL